MIFRRKEKGEGSADNGFLTNIFAKGPAEKAIVCTPFSFLLPPENHFTIDVTGFFTPLYPRRKALAEPKLRNISRRTGMWFASSVT